MINGSPLVNDHFSVKNDPTMSITCSKILKLNENSVDMDEDHPYFRIGKKFVGDRESGF